MSDQTDYKLEYVEVSENLRHFGNIRFAQMTLFFAVTAVFFAALFQDRVELTIFASALLTLIGAATAYLFLKMDQRAMIYWHHYMDRAKMLESSLGFKQYSTAPIHEGFTATRAVTAIYCCAIGLWLIMLVFLIIDFFQKQP